ncbi:MAG: inositol monophosphatase family protein [Cyanobacteria bacterium P01_D01_bin.128]
MLSFSSQQREQLCQAIVTAGDRALKSAKQSFAVFEKGTDDYVTEVDRQLDAQLSAAIGGTFPTDGVISEENPSSFSAFQTDPDSLWLIDPIDGTEDYIHHRPYYSVMVGLLQDYCPVSGWIYAPAFQRLYWGGAGWGLWQCDCDRIDRSFAEAAYSLHPRSPQLGPTETGGSIIIGDRDQQRFGSAIAAQLPQLKVYSLGSFGLKVLEVIRGRAGLYIYLNGRVKLWDTAGPVALALGAGLVCCDLLGQPLKFTPDFVESQTLVHHQTIVIGWSDYIDALLPTLRSAILSVGLRQ